MNRRVRLVRPLPGGLLLLFACRPGGEPADTAPSDCVAAVADVPPVATTLTRTVVAEPNADAPLEENPVFPEGLAAARAAGLGGWAEGGGEPRVSRDDLGHGADQGPDRRSLWLFLHQSDAQLADAESPTRVVGLDAPGPTQSAARPQELYAIHALDALIRTVNRVHAVVPIDFALATGDNADSSQENETTWFRDVWDGVPVHPDSATDDSQPDDLCHDPIAPFEPEGAAFPWYAVAGNHDVLVQGNFDPRDYADDVLGTDAPLGTRDLTEPGGPLAYATAAADATRRVLDRGEVAAVYLDGPETPGPIGHGFSDDNVADGSIRWTARPVADVPVRLVAMDMNPTGGDDGELSADERDGWLIPQLDAAEAAGELVVVAAHYTFIGRAVEGGGTADEILRRYPNVVLVVAGHSHANDVLASGDMNDPAEFFEIRTSATVDWPGQGRLVELVDNGDGTLSIYTTMVDYDAPEGSIAARARELTLIDWQGGWRDKGGPGDAEDRNTELVQKLPDGWSTAAGTPGARSLALP